MVAPGGVRRHRRLAGTGPAGRARVRRPHVRPAADHRRGVRTRGAGRRPPRTRRRPLRQAAADRRAARRARRGPGEQAGDLLDECLAEIVAARPARRRLHRPVRAARRPRSRSPSASRRRCPAPSSCSAAPGCRGEMGEELRRQLPCRRRGGRRRGRGGAPGPRAAPTLGGASGRRGRRARPGGPRRASRSADFGDYFARLAAGPLAGTFTPRVPFETSRGCWWGEKRRCTFCGQASAALELPAARARTARWPSSSTSRARIPAAPVFFTDEIAPRDAFDDARARSCPRRVPGLEVVYFEVRPDLSRRDLEALAAAGVRRLEAGIESLSTPVLRLMRKGTTALQGVQSPQVGPRAGTARGVEPALGRPRRGPRGVRRAWPRSSLCSPTCSRRNTVGELRLDRFSPLFEDPAAFGLSDVHGRAGLPATCSTCRRTPWTGWPTSSPSIAPRPAARRRVHGVAGRGGRGLEGDVRRAAACGTWTTASACSIDDRPAGS